MCLHGLQPGSKEYCCLHLPSSRTYISRDVKFNETQFSFQSLPVSSASNLHSSAFTTRPSESSLLQRNSASQFPTTSSTPLASHMPNPIPNPSPIHNEPLSPISPDIPNLSISHSSPSQSLNLNSTEPLSSLPEADSPSSVSVSHPINPTQSHHPMVTRLHNNIQCLKVRTDGTVSWPSTHLSFSLTKSKVSRIPKEPVSYTKTAKYPEWKDAMKLELQALLHNSTWKLIPPSHVFNILGPKWILKTKRHLMAFLKGARLTLLPKGFISSLG